ncbi:AAA family ATPase [Cellulosimicrobium terreum]|nr:AAA family ATPase [Cellulosimicrobium terreum]
MGSRDPITARPDLSHALLAGKVEVPRPRPSGVSRRGLVDGARESRSRIVAVTAPPGYGKSTMLAEWADAEDRAVAWATLDRLDDDPAALLALLALACSTVSPQVAEVAAEMRGPGPTTLGRSAPLLASALARTATPFVLFVDDLHEAGSPGCQDALGIALGGVPEGSQVVVASRHEQAYLARRRVEGDVLEIGADDLRLDGVGARTVFRGAGVEASDGELATVVDRCEGWPTGVFLCALLVRDGGPASALAGDDRFIADYLYRECLANLSPQTQHFLRCTAVLDQLSATVCDALLGAHDSAARLRELEAAHLFLVPLDHRRGWFRYHALFREFLLAELERVESAHVPELHRRAAQWFTANGLAARAVEHLLAAADRDAAALLVADLALPAYQDGQVDVLARWLAAVGDPAIEACPPLVVVAVWKALLLGETRDAERWAAVLERLDEDGLPDADRVALASARCQVRAAMCVQGTEAALECARFAVEHEPAWSPWRDQALHLLGSVHLLVGSVDAARAAFVEGSQCATAAGNTDSVLLCEAELAVLAIEEGRWSDAGEHTRAAVDAIDAHHMEGYSTTALALAAHARVALHRGETAVAERSLTRAMLARVQCTYVLPFLALRVRLQLAQAYATLGDRTVAMHLAHEMDEILRRRPHVGLLAQEIAAFRDRLEEAAASPGVPPLTPAELRLLPYLQTHLTMAEIGRRLFVSRNTVGSQVGSIYRKLGVTTRGGAVERAVGLGLLGG